MIYLTILIYILNIIQNQYKQLLTYSYPMPYATIADLPDAIRTALPDGGQDIFLSAFNSAYDGTCNGKDDQEACANKIAWSAVKQSYEKDADDKWTEIKQKQHDVILQTLNREIDGHCFGVPAFEETVGDWEGIPLVFANEHPNMNLFSEDPNAALENVNGEIVGNVKSPYIATDGHPRLMSKLTNSNSEVATLINDGQASISTGFFATVDDTKTIMTVVPNHVLVFKEDAQNMPKDHGAFILNKHESTCQIIDKEALNMEETKELSKEIAMANKQIGDMTSRLEIANKENDGLKASVAEKDGLLEVANKTIADNKTRLEEFEQKEADALVARRNEQWKTIKSGIPVGLTHKQEDADALRKEWETDPFAFSTKLVGFEQKAATPPSGNEYAGSSDADAEDMAFISNMNKTLGKV